MPLPQGIKSYHLLSATASILHCMEDPDRKCGVICATEEQRSQMKQRFIEAAGKMDVPLNWFEPHKIRFSNGSECWFSAYADSAPVQTAPAADVAHAPASETGWPHP